MVEPSPHKEEKVRVTPSSHRLLKNKHIFSFLYSSRKKKENRGTTKRYKNPKPTKQGSGEFFIDPNA